MNKNIEIQQDGKEYFFTYEGKRISCNYNSIKVFGNGFLIRVNENPYFYTIDCTYSKDLASVPLLNCTGLYRQVIKINNGYALCRDCDGELIICDCHGEKYKAPSGYNGIVEDVEKDIEKLYEVPLLFFFSSNKSENNRRFRKLEQAVLNRDKDDRYNNGTFSERVVADDLAFKFLETLHKKIKELEVKNEKNSKRL